MKTYHYVLSFGSNVGDRIFNVRLGLYLMGLCGKITRQSRWVRRLRCVRRCMIQITWQLFKLGLCVRDKFATGGSHSFYSRDRAAGWTSYEAKWQSRHLDIDLLYCFVGDGGLF